VPSRAHILIRYRFMLRPLVTRQWLQFDKDFTTCSECLHRGKVAAASYNAGNQTIYVLEDTQENSHFDLTKMCESIFHGSIISLTSPQSWITPLQT
jgi:hypothetical protein